MITEKSFLVEALLVNPHQKTGQVVFVVGTNSSPNLLSRLEREIWGNSQDYEDFSERRLVLRKLKNPTVIDRIQQTLTSTHRSLEKSVLEYWMINQQQFTDWTQLIAELKTTQNIPDTLVALLNQLFLLSESTWTAFGQIKTNHLPNLKINLRDEQDHYFDSVIESLLKKGYQEQHLHLILLGVPRFLRVAQRRFAKIAGELWLVEASHG